MCSSFSYSQGFDITENKNITHHWSFGEYEIFKNNKKNNFFITDSDEKTLIRNLKYCERLSIEYLQAINKKNEIIFFDKNLKTIKKPSRIVITVCGSVNSYSFEILKEGNNYLVQEKIDRYWTGEESTTVIVDTIADQNFDKLYFINHKREMQFDGNDIHAAYVIFEKNSKYGIIDKGNVFLYDAIHIMSRQYTMIEKSGLFNYYHLSPKAKYKRLGRFMYNLAYFELPNGKSGYVDIEGVEYYK